MSSSNAATDRAARVHRSVEESLERLEAYLVGESLRGWDPYDALTSPVFRLPVLRSSRSVRLAAIQAVKRAPINVRPLLGIPKGYNPVTLGFVLQGATYRAQRASEGGEAHRARAIACVDELARLRTPGFSGDCWGYPFDWEARYGRLPAGTPNIVATGLVTNALFHAYRCFRIDRALDMCRSATRFVLEDLPRTYEGERFCWGYYPSDAQRVLNATMKGARLCAQVHSQTGDPALAEAAALTAAYVAAQQRADGSWPYSVGDTRAWADSFHTAYVIDAFADYEQLTGDAQFSRATSAGWRYYRSTFFRPDGGVRYFPEREFPVDATASAQALLTLCRFDDTPAAARTADWTIANMQQPSGGFAYQVRRRRTVRIPYIRWSSAYMYAGLSRLSLALAEGSRAT